MASNNQIKFNAPEFSKIFSRIAEKENKNGYYCVRRLNKFHAAQFEQQIDSGRVNISNLQSLVTSKFSDQIRNLNVRIPGNLENLNELCRASPTFLPNVEKVNVIFTQRQSPEQKTITVYQPLVFRGLNVVSKNQRELIQIQCQNHDVQIIDSNFDGISLNLNRANQLSVQNSSFRNIPRNSGLSCFYTQNTITIDNVKFSNCGFIGLLINQCGNNIVSVNKICAEKCRHGCFFQFVHGELKLNDTKIVDCETGIFFNTVNNSTVQNCNITGAFKTGVRLQGSTVQYQRIFINQSEGVKGKFKKVDSVNSTFTEIL